MLVGMITVEGSTFFITTFSIDLFFEISKKIIMQIIVFLLLLLSQMIR